MGETDRYSDYRRKKSRMPITYENSELISLLFINIVMFVIMVSIRLMYTFNPEAADDFYTEALPYFYLPADFSTFLQRPWTLITYMFTDTGEFFIRLLTNMVWLWTFGYILKMAIGYGKIIGVYLYGGIVGGIVYLIANSLMPTLSSNTGMYGANTGVIAIAVAATILFPKFRIFPMIRNGIPVWVLTLIFLGIDLFAGVGAINNAYRLSHVGAIAAGAGFAVLYQRGFDATTWMQKFYNWFMSLWTPKNKNIRESIRNRNFYHTGNREPYKKQINVTASRIDEILDKINLKGMSHLTTEEKEILRRAAEEDENN